MWICDVWKKKYWILDINNVIMDIINVWNKNVQLSME